MVESRQATDDSMIRRMRFACSVAKATNTYSQCILLITFPRQQWLHECASVLRFTYVACLVSINF